MLYIKKNVDSSFTECIIYLEIVEQSPEEKLYFNHIHEKRKLMLNFKLSL